MSARAKKPAEPVLVTDWYQGDTHPVREGLYERNFTDGVFKQWWDGALWYGWHDGKVHDNPHWRQVGSYVTWRGRRTWVLGDRNGFYLTGRRPLHTLMRDLAQARPFKNERAAKRFAARFKSLGLTAVLP